MKTVLVLAAVVALASAGFIPTFSNPIIKTKNVEPLTVERQHKVLELFEALSQVPSHAGYYMAAKDYDIAAHKGDYKKPEVVEHFLKMYAKGFVPKFHIFTIFDEKMRDQAVALYHLFYEAKDFDVFYATAAWARVHLNEGLFAYSFYIALVQRVDTKDLAIPPLFEIWPEYFVNTDVFGKMYYGKMRGLPFENFPDYGVIESNNEYLYYTNYSDYYTYGKEEYKMAYFTEDIGWNTFYTYFHAIMPFWEKGDTVALGLFKERRGEVYYYFYQQLLARYYLERLSNGLGEIPIFSWYKTFDYGYRPLMNLKTYPFAQRSENYVMQSPKNLDNLRFVRNYEDIFLTFLENGQFKEYNQDVDFYNSKAINFVGNFWQSNPDLYDKVEKNDYHRSYEMSARQILGGAPLTYEYRDYEFLPTALDFYQTSLRDPAFYQIYNKIMHFTLQYKKYLKPYTQDQLHYVGVKINDVHVSKLETFFDLYKFNASNALYWSNEELKTSQQKSFMVVQPRLNREEFKVNISVKADVEEEATFKIFMGPKYDGKGNLIKFEENWMNFVALDWFRFKLTKGENTIVRSSEDFFFYKQDSVSTGELYKFLSEKKMPVDMVESYDDMPMRLMLPRGTKGGFPLQFFVVAYKSQVLPKEFEILADAILDDKPLGYPLERPVSYDFMQPNMYMKNVEVYHKGNEYPYFYEYEV